MDRGITIEVDGISKIFGSGKGAVRALDDVSVSIPENEFFTLLGPSGCGKTTLLKIIAGLLEPTEGTVEVNGKPVNGPGEDRAFVFQDFALLPWASVLRNVAFGLELRGVAKSKREDIAARYIKDVGLAGFENSFPHELSGGQNQRVGIARATISRPKLLSPRCTGSSVAESAQSVLSLCVNVI